MTSATSSNRVIKLESRLFAKCSLFILVDVIDLKTGREREAQEERYIDNIIPEFVFGNTGSKERCLCFNFIISWRTCTRAQV